MTMQAKDPFLWNGERYDLIRAEEIYHLFDPKDYGLNPSCIITCCYKGFIVGFSVKENCLLLDFIEVHCDEGGYPPINGVEAQYKDGELFHRYENIALMLDYSGVIVIGRDLGDRYKTRAYIGPHSYNVVYELYFENGVLKEAEETSGSYTGF